MRLVDLSTGGALVETTRILRPDTDLVLEILDTRTRDAWRVVARILRSQVSAIEDDGVRYRGGCKFRRPLSHPTLLDLPLPAPTPIDEARDFFKLEVALKTIVEDFFTSPVTSVKAGRDTMVLLEALVRLRVAAEHRGDLLNRQLEPLLDRFISALEQHGSPEMIGHDLQALLARELPLVGMLVDQPHAVLPANCQVVTFNVAAEPARPSVHIVAEFPLGYALDDTQFRLLKAGAYLVGLVARWRTTAADAPVSADEQTPAAPALSPAPSRVPATSPEPTIEPASFLESTPALEPESGPLVLDCRDLPDGWHRLVVRFVDGQLVRGYCNEFHPERGHVQVSPRINCQANERLVVPVARLKAVFFVRSLTGDAGRVDDQAWDDVRRGARKMQVLFRDGEVMQGSTLDYKPNRRGFFLRPPNARGNNRRVYVITAATRQTRFV